MYLKNKYSVKKYAQATTVPLFKSFEGPLRNVKVTVPDVVGVHVNVADFPAVTVKPWEIVGGFDVDPDCPATAAKRHAIMESGAMRILNVATGRFMYPRYATK